MLRTCGEATVWACAGIAENFLTEFDNSGGNHIHSVWRDFEGDFGRDVLRDHYRGAEGTAHRHGGR